jgi:hypothetical protein
VPWATHDLPAFAVNQLFRGWGHRFLYDIDCLRAVLELCGFAGVRRCRYGESDHDALRGIERHGADVDRARIEYETLLVEADKAPR